MTCGIVSILWEPIMGMELYGKAPSNEAGEYFSRSVWGWRPLWTYCTSVYPPCARVSGGGHRNDGGGLGAPHLGAHHAKKLARVLELEMLSGRAEHYRVSLESHVAAQPRHKCPHCGGTGTRNDGIGAEKGFADKVCADRAQDGTPHPRAGQKGWCNGCDGVGTQPSWDTHYSFSVEDVREFAEFLKNCGGF